MNNDGHCLVHADEKSRRVALSQLAPEGAVDFRGTTINESLLQSVLKKMTRGSHPVVGPARFDGAEFIDHADFSGVGFVKTASFRQARFSRPARFARTRFHGEARFTQAEFVGDAWFARAQFDGRASFDRAIFSAMAKFDRAQFNAETTFGRAQFDHEAWFQEARFEDDCIFEEAVFEREAWYDWIHFSKASQFQGAMFSQSLSFSGGRFLACERLGPLLTVGRLLLDGTTFDTPILIEAVTPQLSCKSTRFKGQVEFRLRRAEIRIDEAVFERASTIAFAQQFAYTSFRYGTLSAKPVLLDEARLPPSASDGRPTLVSLRRTNVANLTVVDVDLRCCLFHSTQGLDKIRMSGATTLPTTPQGWQLGRLRDGPPVWRWTRRLTVADEHLWRASLQRQRPKRAGWYTLQQQIPEWVQEPPGELLEVPTSAQLSSLYDALARAEREQRHRSGAADFYYGALEMTRIAGPTPRSERLFLTFLWLVSGYGMRASRALLTLAFVIGIFAVPFLLWGFQEPEPQLQVLGVTASGSPIYRVEVATERPPWQRVVDAVSYSAGTAALSPPDDRKLTLTGQVLQVSLRILSSVLLASAVASTIRARLVSPVERFMGTSENAQG